MLENHHNYLFQHSENFDSLLTVQESEDAVTMLAPGPRVAAAATFTLVIGPVLSLIVRYVILIKYFSKLLMFTTIVHHMINKYCQF